MLVPPLDCSSHGDALSGFKTGKKFESCVCRKVCFINLEYACVNEGEPWAEIRSIIVGKNDTVCSDVYRGIVSLKGITELLLLGNDGRDFL